MNNIKRRKTGFGCVLMVEPFGSTSKFTGMKIEAEIARPAGGRGPVNTKFQFSRMPIAEKFSRTEMMTWVEASRALLEATSSEVDRARRVAGSFEPKRVRHMPKKKKATAAK